MPRLTNPQILGSALFDDEIRLWAYQNHDVIMIGKLKGHSAQVTTLQALEDTPLLISGDELGVIKTWDVRTLLCVQTYKSDW